MAEGRGVSISVVTVCRNAGAALSELRAAVYAALGDCDEWVLQDGASSDGSTDWVPQDQDHRLKYVSAPDTGIYDALNRAVARASGSFVWILGVDDRPSVTCDEVRGYLRDIQTVYYGDVFRPLSNDTYAGKFTVKRLARTNICQQAIFYPAHLLKRNGFDLRYPYQSDWVKNMELMTSGDVQFKYVNRVVAVYGQGGVSSNHFDVQFQNDYPMLLRRYFRLSERWYTMLLFCLSKIYRALPGVPGAQQKHARA